MQQVRILFQDEDLVVFEKPAGVSVHPPEDPTLSRRGVDLIRILRTQTGRSVFPVHRLDRATQGVMVMAFDGKTAGKIQSEFRSGGIEKSYLLMCRGWTSEDGVIEIPLESNPDVPDSPLQEARTSYATLAQFELPIPCGRYPTSRFSLVEARPGTGRFHQIRRHFRKISHPLIGDSRHGDGRQNRLWRELLGESRLFLMAWSLGFRHPRTGDFMRFRSRFAKAWHPVFDRAGVCPISQRS